MWVWPDQLPLLQPLDEPGDDRHGGGVLCLTGHCGGGGELCLTGHGGGVLCLTLSNRFEKSH